MTSRALEIGALSRPFHYLERSVTVNTVIYGRCTGVSRNQNFRNTTIRAEKSGPNFGVFRILPATDPVGDLRQCVVVFRQYFQNYPPIHSAREWTP